MKVANPRENPVGANHVMLNKYVHNFSENEFKVRLPYTNP